MKRNSEYYNPPDYEHVISESEQEAEEIKGLNHMQIV
jgi:hypothetical protein